MIYLYAPIKVMPLNDNSIKITKTAVNAPDPNKAYGFNLKLIVTAAMDQSPLDEATSREVLLLKAAQVEANKKLDEAKQNVSNARSDLFQSMFLTTTGSNLKFILTGPEMDDGVLPVMYSATTGSMLEYEFTEYKFLRKSVRCSWR